MKPCSVRRKQLGVRAAGAIEGLNQLLVVVVVKKPFVRKNLGRYVIGYDVNIAPRLPDGSPIQPATVG
jgi:hypothetical protein